MIMISKVGLKKYVVHIRQYNRIEEDKMDNQNNTIDLRQLFRMLNYYKVIIIIIAIIVTGLYGLYSYFAQSQDKIYKTEAQIYTEEKAVKDNVVNGASNHIMNDYAKLVKSDFVLNDVRSNFKTEYTISDLKSKITTITEADSNVISIECTDSDPEVAKNIVNQVASSTVSKINNTSEYYHAYVISTADIPKTPISNNVFKSCIKLFVVLLVLISVVVVCIYLIRDNVRDEEALEKKVNADIFYRIPKVKNIEKYLLKYGSEIFSKIYILSKNACKTLLITSPNSKDGKSLVAEGLADQFAVNNKNTLLLKIGNQEEWSIKENNFNKSVEVLNIESGLTNELLCKHITSLQNNYDVIIIDSKNFNAVETYALMDYCDSALFIANPHKVGTKKLVDMKNKLEKSNCKLIGLVFNKVRF